VFAGAVVAHADPAFVLTQSGAGPGDRVGFTISGPDGRATYSLEVAGEDVAEGSVPADSAVSGSFTMPDLGSTSKAVTVEAQITQSDETTTRERSFRYLAPSQVSTGSVAPQPAPAASVAPAAQSAPPGQPAPPSKQGKRRAPRPAPAKRRAQRSPPRQVVPWRPPVAAPTRDTSEPPVAPSPGRAAAPTAPPRARGKERTASTGSPQRPQGHRADGAWPNVTSFLTGAPAPAILSLASGVPGNGAQGAPVSAWIVLLLLASTALVLAGPGVAPRRRPRRFKRRAPSRRIAGVSPPASTNGASAPARAREGEVEEAFLQEAAASFAPIALAALDLQATLATRSERKYILDTSTFERLIGELAPNYLILEIDGGRVFSYDTVYFDTPELTTYRQHVQGRRKRFKCRTRLYAESALCFFEVKLKGGRGETIKRRLELGVEEHGSLTDPALGFLDHELHEAYGARSPAILGPVLRTVYRRLTLAGRTDSERLTFDFELKFAANGDEYAIQPGRILLETKVGAARAEGGRMADSAVQRLGVRPVRSCSKYCLGVALAHPEFADNPFRPVIRNHFDADRHALPPGYDLRPVAPPMVEPQEEPQQTGPTIPTWQEGTA
jgi:VTC domain-containing protein